MNIDWNEIKNKCTKSYEKFKLFKADKEFGTKLSPSYLNEWFNKNIKSICYCDIEKFFDDNEICISIACSLEEDWYFYFNTHIVLEDNIGFESRQEAQTQAVYKAMEIMEGMIK